MTLKFGSAPCPYCGYAIKFHDIWTDEHNDDFCYIDCEHCGNEVDCEPEYHAAPLLKKSKYNKHNASDANKLENWT